ncbi:MAG: protein kinase [Nitriliruptorales bacterium]|nr:protein kinase [Nitriliruptorales bacterium]
MTSPHEGHRCLDEARLMSEPIKRTETLRDLAQRFSDDVPEEVADSGVGVSEQEKEPDPAGSLELEPTGAMHPIEDTDGLVDAELRLLSGRYLLQERVASGGMASVWRARDQVLARTVAVKLLHDHLAADAAFRERFRREAISAAKLSHPFIVGIFDSGVDGDQVFLVMEFVEGVTLRDVIAEVATLPPAHAATIGEKIARALDYAHAHGLVHRDVKPANILIGNDGSVKVADFGIAKADQADDLTKTGMVLGTAAYVAPEQILAHPIDGKADQYALGCVLFESLTGRQPFRADSAVATAAQRLERKPPSVRSYRPDVPQGLDRVVGRAMAREPQQRFPTVGHLADVLAAFSDEEIDRTSALVSTAEPRPPVPQRDSGAIALESRPAPPRRPARWRPPPIHDDSFGQVPTPSRQRNWLLPTLGLLVFAIGLAAALATGALDGRSLPTFGEEPGEEQTAEPPESAAPTMLALDASSLTSFDPQGNDLVENEARLPNLVDNDPETEWTTVGYNAADFAGLKSGVGFFVDLGQVTRVESVEFGISRPGFDFELRAADDRPSSIDDTRFIASQEGAGEEGVTWGPGSDPVETRYLVVWITGNLPADGQRFRAGFDSVSVFAATE